uniref:Putative secreted protein n=1 Tax=Ixodes ricinus TaxID=34613 RepID=A0A6B0UT10_IXORI
MNSKLWVCVVGLVLSCLVTENGAVTSHAEFKKRLLSVNPALMTPQCRKVFRSCSMKMLGLLGLLDVIKDRWDEYTAVPCVKTMLENNYPDYTIECSRSGRYGESISCLESPEATAFLDEKHKDSLESGIKCLLDNSLP